VLERPTPDPLTVLTDADASRAALRAELVRDSWQHEPMATLAEWSRAVANGSDRAMKYLYAIYGRRRLREANRRQAESGQGFTVEEIAVHRDVRGSLDAMDKALGLGRGEEAEKGAAAKLRQASALRRLALEVRFKAGGDYEARQMHTEIYRNL